MNETEWSWAAGLFEGEGTIYAKKTLDRRYARLVVTSTDRDVLERFTAICGGKVYQRKAETDGHYGGRTVYNAIIERSDAALAVVEMFSPWLGERRLAQIEAVKIAVAANPADRRKDGTAWKKRRERYGPSGGNAASRLISKEAA